MAFPELPILLVDDDDAFLHSARLALFSEGLEYVLIMPDPKKVMSCIQQTSASLVVLDLNMPSMDGFTLLQEIVASYPQIPVVILSGTMDVEMVVACMKAGAKDYQVKPLSAEGLSQVIRKQLEHCEVLEEATRLKKSLLRDGLENPEAFAHIDTQSPKMIRLFSYAEAISKTGMPVLVTGETGTGKELVARALHKLRHPRAPFVAVNVAGLDDAMFSDSLFGHQKGAYTGALVERKGLVESANEGTLFLDEIGDLTPESQVKLLRLIQEGEYFPLGADHPRKVRLWILAATHRPIATMESFRRDLFYRLQSHWIDLPPLRERSSDLSLLVHSILQSIAPNIGRSFSPLFAQELIQRIQHYHFPGNIRELHGLVVDVSGSASREEIIDEEVLARWVGKESTAMSPVLISEPTDADVKVQFGTTLPSMKEMEDLLIEEALQRFHGNRTLAASTLGVSRQTLLNHSKKNGVTT